jgi:hypothetical protein
MSATKHIVVCNLAMMETARQLRETGHQMIADGNAKLLLAQTIQRMASDDYKAPMASVETASDPMDPEAIPAFLGEREAA